MEPIEGSETLAFRTQMPGNYFFIHLPMKMEPIEGSKTSAFRTQTPGNYPKENILHNEHGKSLKSRNIPVMLTHVRNMITWENLSFGNM